ncbi:MAG: NAD(P)/FAD-dependent oxidoreductase [Proteobacteria bacterium]|nr:NAD(P)/FAD-dependent oxidoreductase [Pseudomonadota bacterium]MBU1711828.1 NAD(P)/FAD-dependent oxidoreductase [Pseudomonadota bacterium]
MMYDVAVIGGGVIGCAIARELSRYRLSIVIVEKFEEVGFGTTKTNSGIIHAGHHSPPDTLKGKLVVRGNKLYDRLCKDLNFGFSRIGELVVARSESEIPELERLKKQGEAKGVPGLEVWDRERLRNAEPNLSNTLVAALHAPSAGVINPYELANALSENAVDNGVDLKVNCAVEKIVVKKGFFTVHTPPETIKARFVINCAGVYADKIAGMVGLRDFTIHPRKGEEYMLDKRLKGLVQRLIFPIPSKNTKGILIIPTFDGTIMVGPTAQDNADRDDASTTYEGSEQVFGFVSKICPSITERDTITEFAGLRAVSSTNDFIIGPTRIKGFINAAGIQSPGLTSAPAIALYVRDILKSEGLVLKKKGNFKPHLPGPPRFASLNYEQQKRLVEKDRLFAKVVCRCELVTEAEIHSAVDHGARTLDGIKFRSRAGMGRCQGGFCSSRCMDILSKRLDKPFEEITKRGGDSWVVRKMTDDV